MLHAGGALKNHADDIEELVKAAEPAGAGKKGKLEQWSGVGFRPGGSAGAFGRRRGRQQRGLAMKIRTALALVVAGAFVGQAVAGEKYTATWWNGVAYRNDQDHFGPGAAATGRPPLVSRTAWKSEKSPLGTLIRVGKGYLTADDQGLIRISPRRTAGSYWVMKEVKTERGCYNAKDDWSGTWSRTTYTLEPLAAWLQPGKLGFRQGKLTLHPQNKGLAILSVTRIDAREVSGK
ncbi:MAG TPA: hypothetical protein VKD72_38850 [Gemmataceae bacterium]|nr:hypothetical protein [Gemmataceae bacterium]